MAVGLYCAVSGCSPRIPLQVKGPWRPSDTFFSRDDPHERLLLDRVRLALDSIVDADEQEGLEDLVVIGPVRPDFVPCFDYDPCSPERHYLSIPLTDIHLIPSCSAPMSSAFITSSVTGRRYNVVTGAYIVLCSSTLAIIESATGGRLTPQRLWRLIMSLRASYRKDRDESWDFMTTALPSGLVNYGVLDGSMQARPWDLPGWRRKERGRAALEKVGVGLLSAGVKGKERAGQEDELESYSESDMGSELDDDEDDLCGLDVRDVRKRRSRLETEADDRDFALIRLIVHDGGFWGWMRPDRFPIVSSPHDLPLPTVPIRRWHTTQTPSIPLPSEVILQIASHVPSKSYFSLASTSRSLRSLLLSRPSLNYYARADIALRKPWCVPSIGSAGGVERREWTANWAKVRPELVSTTSNSDSGIESDSSENLVDVDVDPMKGASDRTVDWSYWTRCVKAKNASMRNRERIWKIVVGLETLAELREREWVRRGMRVEIS